MTLAVLMLVLDELDDEVEEEEVALASEAESPVKVSVTSTPDEAVDSIVAVTMGAEVDVVVLLDEA